MYSIVLCSGLRLGATHDPMILHFHHLLVFLLQFLCLLFCVNLSDRDPRGLPVLDGFDRASQLDTNQEPRVTHVPGQYCLCKEILYVGHSCSIGEY